MEVGDIGGESMSAWSAAPRTYLLTAQPGEPNKIRELKNSSAYFGALLF
jgi:hypothetical protein